MHAFGGTLVRGSGKCLDYTPDAVGSPVFLNACDSSHPIQVHELAGPNHEVALVASSLVIGMRSPDPILLGDVSAQSTELPLQLQDPAASAGSLEALYQTFALDGDSIIRAADRHLVAQVQHGRGTDGTPIVAGSRLLADSEFWDFRATDGSAKDPSKAFLHVSSVDGLLDLLNTYDCVSGTPGPFQWACARFPVGPGNVIVIDASIDLPAGLPDFRIPEPHPVEVLA